jgi:putative ATP-binding cassette transporter
VDSVLKKDTPESVAPEAGSTPAVPPSGPASAAPSWLSNLVRGMPYINLLVSIIGGEAITIIALSALSGIANGTIVMVINAAAVNREGGESQTINLLWFGLTIALFLWARKRVLLRCGQKIEVAVSRLRINLADRIRHSDFSVLERLEPSGIYVILTECTTTMSQAVLPVVNAVGSGVMVVFCLLYLYSLSAWAFALNIALLVIGVLQFLRVQRKVEASLGEALRTEASFFAVIRQLLDGIKEIKLNAARGDDIRSGRILPLSQEAAQCRIRANRHYVGNWNFIKILSYLLIGAMVFLLPIISEKVSENLIELVTVVLFLFSPVGDLVDAMPLLARANAAVSRLDLLEKNLPPPPQYGEESDSVRQLADSGEFARLDLRGAEYSHLSPGGETLFTIGPIDLAITKGETVFFIGGNGSGKSTFLRMLVGLYPAGNGCLFFNGVAVDQANLPAYQANFSTVFTDFHLFDRLYGLDEVARNKAADLLDRMGIGDKTRIENGEFTQLNLSTGQRKRIALIVAMLEDRPILVFDEVAADQDPEFRERFYREMLPELKAQGKTVVVVSHDDRYFDQAEKIFKMDYGRVVVSEPETVKAKRKRTAKPRPRSDKNDK